MSNELFVEEGYNGAKYYDKDAVDALLSKKDAAIAELKQKCEAEKSIGATFSENGAELARWVEELRTQIESLKASHYAEMVDAGMRERELRRALWLARAESARNASVFWEQIYTEEPRGAIDTYDINYCVVTQKVLRTPFEWITKWQNVEKLCRAKAEQFK